MAQTFFFKLATPRTGEDTEQSPVSHTAGETHRDPVAEAELLAEPPEKNNSEAIILHN